MINVVCGIILYNKKILIAKNPASHKYAEMWEFPGGKIEPNEINFEAVIREIKEELSLEVSPLFALNPIVFADISLQPIFCTTAQEEFALHHHTNGKWITFDELFIIKMAPTDKELILIYRKELEDYIN